MTTKTEAAAAAGIGHNQPSAKDLLEEFAERISKKLDEVVDIQVEVKALKTEAKAAGFDMKALNGVVRAKMTRDQSARIQTEQVARDYLRLVGFEVAS